MKKILLLAALLPLWSGFALASSKNDVFWSKLDVTSSGGDRFTVNTDGSRLVEIITIIRGLKNVLPQQAFNDLFDFPILNDLAVANSSHSVNGNFVTVTTLEFPLFSEGLANTADAKVVQFLFEQGRFVSRCVWKSNKKAELLSSKIFIETSYNNSTLDWCSRIAVKY